LADIVIKDDDDNLRIITLRVLKLAYKVDGCKLTAPVLL
jgi:hypothetical protein